MQKGEIVTVRLYGGIEAPRRFVKDKGGVVVICAESEYLQAEIEGRDPAGLAFPREDVLELAGTHA